MSGFVNSADFSSWHAVMAEARGFGVTQDSQGNITALSGRSGGIIEPRRARIPKGAVLVRAYPQAKSAEHLGKWWSSPATLLAMIDYWGMDPVAPQEQFGGESLLSLGRKGTFKPGVGRTGTMSALEGLLGMRAEWATGGLSGAAAQATAETGIDRYVFIEAIADFQVLIGEGDHAQNKDWSHNLKPYHFTRPDGERGIATQIFFPQAWNYKDKAYKVVAEHLDDRGFWSMLQKLRNDPGPLLLQ